MKKAWRVSISNYAVSCFTCDNIELTEKEKDEITSSGDYCGTCQYVTVGYVDQRSDYADYTIGYYDKEGKAVNEAKKLKPFSL